MLCHRLFVTCEHFCCQPYINFYYTFFCGGAQNGAANTVAETAAKGKLPPRNSPRAILKVVADAGAVPQAYGKVMKGDAEDAKSSGVCKGLNRKG